MRLRAQAGLAFEKLALIAGALHPSGSPSKACPLPGKRQNITARRFCGVYTAKWLCTPSGPPSEACPLMGIRQNMSAFYPCEAQRSGFAQTPRGPLRGLPSEGDKAEYVRFLSLRSPAKRVRREKEPQRNERASFYGAPNKGLSFVGEKAKHYRPPILRCKHRKMAMR